MELLTVAVEGFQRDFGLDAPLDEDDGDGGHGFESFFVLQVVPARAPLLLLLGLPPLQPFEEVVWGVGESGGVYLLSGSGGSFFRGRS